MGVRNPAALDRADGAYEEWARVGLRSGDLVAWVVEAVNHGVVGGGCLWLRPEQPHPDVSTPVEPYLFSMFTEPEFRRKGIASRIIKEAVKWSRRKGYRRILLHANKKGRRLYRKHGFKRTWEMRLKFRQSQ